MRSLERPLRFLFVVQGEGRGHMTQALSMQAILAQAGHSVSAVLLGRSEQRPIPAFFSEAMQAPLIPFQSPNFVTDPQFRSILLLPTIQRNVRQSPVFLKSLAVLKESMEVYQPDVVINFYDTLIGLYYWWYRPKIPLVSIAHQYFLQHPACSLPAGHQLDKRMLFLVNRLTSLRATAKLALSFYPAADLPAKKMYVVPPLLRPEVQTLTTAPQQKHYTVYVTNHGYGQEIIAWHERNRETVLHCFWDKKDVPDGYAYHKNLIFHRVDGHGGHLLLPYMASAKAYITTAGFESVCEAMYLKKPVAMVPIEGHFEQLCNAHDAVRAGAGMFASSFELDTFMQYFRRYQASSIHFQKWAGQASQRILKRLNMIAEKSRKQNSRPWQFTSLEPLKKARRYFRRKKRPAAK